MHFEYFSYQAWFFVFINLNLLKDLSRNKDFKTVKCELLVKALKILVAELYKIAICKKTKCFVTFSLFFLKSIDL